MTAASDVKLGYSGGISSERIKSSSGTGYANNFTATDQTITNTLSPVKQSIQVTSKKEITITYDANIVANDINTTNGKNRFSLQIDNTDSSIAKISISNRLVIIETSSIMTAASDVKLGYSGGINSERTKSSSGTGYANNFTATDQTITNTLSPIKQSIQVTSKKEITITYDANIVANDINTTNGKNQFSLQIDNTDSPIAKITISNRLVIIETSSIMTAASDVKLGYSGGISSERIKSSSGTGYANNFTAADQDHYKHFVAYKTIHSSR